MPLPPMKPAPANIAAFGEGPDPAPYSHLMKEAELAGVVRRTERLTPLGIAALVGALLGAAAVKVSLAALGALLFAFALAAAYARYRAAMRRAELAQLRAAMVMPYKVVEPEPDVEHAGLGVVVDK